MDTAPKPKEDAPPPLDARLGPAPLTMPAPSPAGSPTSSSTPATRVSSPDPITAVGSPPTSPPPAGGQRDISVLCQQFRDRATAILKGHTTYEVIPNSCKVVVFDSRIPVKYAFFGLNENKIKGAPVWDSKKRTFIGMLTITDFIDILRHFHNEHVGESSVAEALDKQLIRDWVKIKKARGTSYSKLLSVPPEASLYETVELMATWRIHRVCVLQEAKENNVLCTLVLHRITKFLLAKFTKEDSFLSVTVRELREAGVGTFKNIVQITYETPLIQALNLLSDLQISCVPIVEDGKAVDIYSRSDVRYLAMDNVFDISKLTVGEALRNHQTDRPVPSCVQTDTIETVLARLVESNKHRIVCVDEHKKMEGLISLSDIYDFILDKKARRRRQALDVVPRGVVGVSVESPHQPDRVGGGGGGGGGHNWGELKNGLAPAASGGWNVVRDSSLLNVSPSPTDVLLDSSPTPTSSPSLPATVPSSPTVLALSPPTVLSPSQSALPVGLAYVQGPVHSLPAQLGSSGGGTGGSKAAPSSVGPQLSAPSTLSTAVSSSQVHRHGANDTVLLQQPAMVMVQTAQHLPQVGAGHSNSRTHVATSTALAAASALPTLDETSETSTAELLPHSYPSDPNIAQDSPQSPGSSPSPAFSSPRPASPTKPLNSTTAPIPIRGAAPATGSVRVGISNYSRGVRPAGSVGSLSSTDENEDEKNVLAASFSSIGSNDSGSFDEGMKQSFNYVPSNPPPSGSAPPPTTTAAAPVPAPSSSTHPSTTPLHRPGAGR